MHIKFDQSPEGQTQAREVVGAIRQGHLDRVAAKPLFVGEDGRPVYRILLCGLHWQSDGKGTSCYRAYDGVIGESTINKVRCVAYRQWAVGKDAKGLWGVVLHDDRDGSLHIIAEGLRTCGEGKSIAAAEARRMPWLEGADT